MAIRYLNKGDWDLLQEVLDYKRGNPDAGFDDFFAEKDLSNDDAKVAQEFFDVEDPSLYKQDLQDQLAERQEELARKTESLEQAVKDGNAESARRAEELGGRIEKMGGEISGIKDDLGATNESMKSNFSKLLEKFSIFDKLKALLPGHESASAADAEPSSPEIPDAQEKQDDAAEDQESEEAAKPEASPENVPAASADAAAAETPDEKAVDEEKPSGAAPAGSDPQDPAGGDETAAKPAAQQDEPATQPSATQPSVEERLSRIESKIDDLHDAILDVNVLVGRLYAASKEPASGVTQAERSSVPSDEDEAVISVMKPNGGSLPDLNDFVYRCLCRDYKRITTSLMLACDGIESGFASVNDAVQSSLERGHDAIKKHPEMFSRAFSALTSGVNAARNKSVSLVSSELADAKQLARKPKLQAPPGTGDGGRQAAPGKAGK